MTMDYELELCDGPLGPDPEQGVTMTRTGNREIIQALYEAFNRGDIPAVLAGLDAQVEWTVTEGNTYPGTFRGRDAVLHNIFMKLGTEWDGFSVTPHQFVIAGDTVVMLGEYGGTYKETGKPIHIPVAHAFTFHGGRATRFVEYTDLTA